VLGLSSAQVNAALKYIDEHKEEVLADYQKIMDRIARSNPPEIEAKLVQSRAKLQALLEAKRMSQKSEGNHAGDSRGQ
jgi:hypothetical protein